MAGEEAKPCFATEKPALPEKISLFLPNICPRNRRCPSFGVLLHLPGPTSARRTMYTYLPLQMCTKTYLNDGMLEVLQTSFSVPWLYGHGSGDFILWPSSLLYLLLSPHLRFKPIEENKKGTADLLSSITRSKRVHSKCELMQIHLDYFLPLELINSGRFNFTLFYVFVLL